MGDYRHAEVWLREVLEIKQRWLMEQFTGLSRSERKMLWTEERSFLQNTASLAVKASQEGDAAQAKRTAALAYEAALFGKGLLLETSKALQAALSAAGDSVLLGAYETLVSSRRVLTQQRALPESERDATVVAFHESRAATAEKMLSRALPAFNEARANQVIAFQDVVKSLDAGEAAIEFVSFEDADNGSTYAALVATPGQKWPLCIPLENAEPWVLGWDTLALAEAQYEAINRDLGLLYDVLWRPLVPALRDARRVYVSGTGVFDRLPLHALYTAGTGAGSRDYVGDLWDIRLVASTRDLVRAAFKQPIAVEPELLAYGYVNYNAIPPALPEVAPDNQEQLAWFGSEPGWRRDGREWGPLPTLAGTEIELYRIEQALKTGGWRSTMRSELSASEHQLKADLQAQRPGVLHFATHGFAYLNPYQEEDFHQFKGGELGEATRFRTTFRVGEDPFDRTGLMLAGGNFSWTGMPQAMMDQTGEDGVLTASEVSDFDLSGTGVVVLSACETGLGTLDATEGAQGLHLAFKLAGADAVIQSLWAVPDVETKDLMVRFYEALAASGDVEASFAAARNAMREDAILAEKPAYWAAFVMKR
jgi:CHAT domain-containing protein